MVVGWGPLYLRGLGSHFSLCLIYPPPNRDRAGGTEVQQGWGKRKWDPALPGPRALKLGSVQRREMRS